MIVGTAGHIDHGKTTLVRALTGVDTDRLPEEKARGISIELGYAFMPAGDAGGTGAERIGFIDVPGHERLVHTMIAGATGIDFGLLLVAADDGVMPQTREHLAVLSLLGVARGAVAITKADRADAARLAEVGREVEALVAGSALDGAPVFVVSAQSGAGIDALRAAIVEASRQRGAGIEAEDDAAFRLAIDRAFTLAGVGTVVTGTIHAGHVRIGDELALAPPADGERARVRSLHAQNRAVEVAHAGERCAIALPGLAKERVARGQWLVDPQVALQTDRFDATLALWPAEARALRSGTPVHVHVGAAHATGSVAVLQADGRDAAALEPGHAGWVQLVLRHPIGAWRGDRVILRDASASRTIGGGIVLDPAAPQRYRRTPQRLAELSALALPTPEARLRALVDAARNGLSLAAWARAEGRLPEAHWPLPADVLRAGGAGAGGGAAPRGAGHSVAADDAWALAAAHAATIGATALDALRAFHAREPELLGPDAARLRRLAAPRLPDALWKALLTRLQHEGRLVVHGAFVHLPEHGARLSAGDERIAQKIAPLLAVDDFEGRWVRDLAAAARESEALVRGALARQAQRGELHQVVKDLYYAPATLQRAAAIVRGFARDGHAVTAARFRDATGLGRKRAIQILEYLDRIGLLRRVGDEHRLRADSILFAEEVG